MPSIKAEVVLAALDAQGFEIRANYLADQRDFALEDLVLEVAGIGGHYHPLTAEDSRNQVGKCFAQTGFRFDSQASSLARGGRMLVFEVLGDSLSHLHLAGPELIGREVTGQQTVGA